MTWSADEEMLQRCRDHVESGRVVVFDTETMVRLAKRLVPGQPSYSLASLIDALKIDGNNTHDALDDTRACGELFMDLVRRIPKSSENAYETI